MNKVGLVLGSGSARGWAHIGVIRALTEAGFRIVCVAGTSIGAFVGAAYAAGRLDALEEVVEQLDWKQIAHFFSDIAFSKSGLVEGEKIAGFLRAHVKEENIEELPVPFCAVATDLATGDEVVLREGNLVEAVRASISVPGIFKPVRRGDAFLVDGGLVNPVPVSAARKMGADFVVAVDLNHDIVARKGIHRGTSTGLSPDARTDRDSSKTGKLLEALDRRLATLDVTAVSQLRQWMDRPRLPNILEVLMASINIMETQITVTKLKTDPPDLLIQPKLGHIRFLEFHCAAEAIEEGFRETKARIDGMTGKGERRDHP